MHERENENFSLTLTVNGGRVYMRWISQWKESSRGKLSVPLTVSKVRSFEYQNDA